VRPRVRSQEGKRAASACRQRHQDCSRCVGWIITVLSIILFAREVALVLSVPCMGDTVPSGSLLVPRLHRVGNETTVRYCALLHVPNEVSSGSCWAGGNIISRPRNCSPCPALRTLPLVLLPLLTTPFPMPWGPFRGSPLPFRPE
jgi:hypothetical protein